jgi:hypothetical protein
MKWIIAFLFVLLMACSDNNTPCLNDPLPNCPKCGNPMNSQTDLVYNVFSRNYFWVYCSRCFYSVRVLPLDNPKCKCEKE